MEQKRPGLTTKSVLLIRLGPAERSPNLGFTRAVSRERERDFFIDNLLVRIDFIIVMVRWTGLVPWKFDSLFQVAL